jgi:hypothetical protein
MAKTTIWVAFVLFIGSGVPAAADASKAVRLGVRLNNRAGVDAAILNEAAQLVTRIYARAGVEITWIDESAPADFPPLQLTVVVTEDAPTALTRKGDVFGVAAVPHARCGRVAYVLWNRVSMFAATERRDAVEILGPIMAHEIGHLLLSRHSHTAVGIMRAHWTPSTFSEARTGHVGFDHGQTQQLHQQIAHEVQMLNPR